MKIITSCSSSCGIVRATQESWCSMCLKCYAVQFMKPSQIMTKNKSKPAAARKSDILEMPDNVAVCLQSCHRSGTGHWLVERAFDWNSCVLAPLFCIVCPPACSVDLHWCRVDPHLDRPALLSVKSCVYLKTYNLAIAVMARNNWAYGMVCVEKGKHKHTHTRFHVITHWCWAPLQDWVMNHRRGTKDFAVWLVRLWAELVGPWHIDMDTQTHSWGR